MSENNTLANIATEFALLLDPIAEAAILTPKPYGFLFRLEDAGINLSQFLVDDNQLIPTLDLIAQLYEPVRTRLLTAGVPSLKDLPLLLDATTAVVNAVNNLATLRLTETSAIAARDIPRLILDYCILKYLKKYRPTLYHLFKLFGVVIEANPDEGIPGRFYSERLPDLINNPAVLARETYGWGTAAFNPDPLLQSLSRVLEGMGLLVIDQFTTEEERAELGEAVPDDRESYASQQIRLLLLSFLKNDVYNQLGLTIMALMPTATGGDDGGLAIVPFGTAETSIVKSINSNVTFRFSANAEATTPFGLVARPNTFAVKGLGNQAPPNRIAMSASILRDRGNDGEPTFLFGQSNIGRVDVTAIGLRLGFEYQSEPDFVIGFPIRGLISLNPPQGDGFVASLIPQGGISAPFEVEVGWSLKNRLYIGVAGGLETTVAINKTLLNTFQVDSATYGLRVEDDTIKLSAAISGEVAIGPVKATIDKVGMQLSLAPESNGNLGLMDVDFDFKSPSGIGLAIDASAITGGGFLTKDNVNNRWFGALSLEFSQRTLEGVVLSEADSLLGIVWATGLGIPAPGGSIEGLGIIFGSDRRANQEAFIQGLKNNVLDAVLFPDDPIRQAPQLLTTLSQLFPRAANYTLIGIMAQWVFGGQARLAVAELGILVEFKGDRLQRILLLGQGRIRIHRLPESQFRINLELFGVLDFEKDEYLLKISLRDSKLLGSELSGDGLIYWRGDRGFIVSLGGFHPKYPAPPGELFRLSRLTASIVNRDNLKIGFECYVALTSTCFQIGGKLFLWAGAKGFSLEGLLGFDALFESNREFTIQLLASVAIKRKKRTLASVSFQGELTGVAPWRINGEVKFHILFWDVSISVAYEFGSRPTTPLETVNARSLLLAALETPANWLIDHSKLGVVLVERQRPGVWLAPNSKISVSQNVLPLGKTITRLGSSPLPQPEKFVLQQVRLGGQLNSTWRFVNDDFTPSLYNEVDLEQAIRAPQFESLPAGITFDSQNNISLGQVVDGGGNYEEVTIDDQAPSNVVSGLISSNMFERRFIPEADFYRSDQQAIAVKPTEYVLIDDAFQVRSSNMSYSQAKEELLNQQRFSSSRLSIVRTSEVPADAVVVA
ncbi:hypothetical protein LC593_11980 [Nostoc sp. CHAB 5844]|nr:hypothetical protein [Nostoc sp. CHAB 5844]